MNLLHPELPSPHGLSIARPSTATKLAGPALFAGAALLLVGAGLALGAHRPPSPGSECGLPAGVQLADLDRQDARLVTRQLLACADLEAGRITAEHYLSTVTALDAEWAHPPVALPAVVWASSVRGFSTQYSESSWSAAQALGAPNVYPASGDNAKAWASLGADDRDEWLEVGFDRPGSVSGVEIYETFNPGAIGRIELLTASGRTLDAQTTAAAPGQGSMRRTATVRCTSEPIVAVRVHVASASVAGWNEIDAIGVVPCTP